MILMKQPPSLAEKAAQAKRQHVERTITEAAARYPVEGALRVWWMGLEETSVKVIRWNGPGVRLTCATMEEAVAMAAEVEAQPGQWWAIIVDGREVGR